MCQAEGGVAEPTKYTYSFSLTKALAESTGSSLSVYLSI